MVKGSVTISIEDFQEFLKAAETTQEVRGKFRVAIKELQVFLSFLATRENIEKHVKEFNRQSQTSQIVFEGTQAKIEIKNDKETTKEV